MKSFLIWTNVILRGIMEVGLVAAFAYWGFHTGSTYSTKIILCIVAPLVGFGVWGWVDFHESGKYSEWYRLTEELVISGGAAWALFLADQPVFGWIMITLTVVHHILIYVLGYRLLKE